MSQISGVQQIDADIVPEALTWAIVESPAEILFEEVRGDLSPFLLYPRGRAFGPAGELRWVRLRRGWHAVYISDAGLTLHEPHGQRELVLSEDRAWASRLLLRGVRHADGLFREGRIPRALSYPVTSDSDSAVGAALEIRRYTAVDGPADFWRMVRPVAIEV